MGWPVICWGVGGVDVMGVGEVDVVVLGVEITIGGIDDDDMVLRVYGVVGFDIGGLDDVDIGGLDDVDVVLGVGVNIGGVDDDDMVLRVGVGVSIGGVDGDDMVFILSADDDCVVFVISIGWVDEEIVVVDVGISFGWLRWEWVFQDSALLGFLLVAPGDFFRISC